MEKQTKEQRKREREREKLTRFICKPCREGYRTEANAPGGHAHAGNL
jgi:hypothetical protein